MAKLYCIKNDATDTFFVVAADEDSARGKYDTFLVENPSAPQGDGTAIKDCFLVASDTAEDVAPWATFVE